MKFIVAILVYFVCSSALWAQLNCKKTTNEKDEQITQCFHKNGKVATIETWDKDRRMGKFVGLDVTGKQLFYYNLRSFGGHASVAVRYFSNGQVQRVDYSDAPDGGIQFYRSTITFDEQGKQLDFQETYYPFEQLTVPQLTPPPAPKQQEIATCAVLFKNYFALENTTSTKVKVRVIEVRPNTPMSIATIYQLKSNETFVFDTIITAQLPLTERKYTVELVHFKKKRKFKKIRIIIPSKLPSTADSKTWLWRIEKDD